MDGNNFTGAGNVGRMGSDGFYVILTQFDGLSNLWHTHPNMRRRTVLQWFAGIGTTIRAWSQTTVLAGPQSAALRELAAVVLPSALGRDGTDRIAAQFERYTADYRPGADTEHGYGFTRVRPKPPSPAAEYVRQLAAMPKPITRETVAAQLEAAKIKDIPRLPDGINIIADLMSFYYRGADANDLCYRAEIKRDTCRGLAGSGKAPAPLKGKV